MIKVTVFKDSEKVFQGIELDGHAGYGVHGQDIICAATSVLALNFANSIEQFTKDEFEGSVEEETGSFRFHFTSTISLESQLLMNSLILGLENIQREYGTQYIKFRFEEV